MADERKTLTAYEAADILGVSPATVYQLCHRADFPSLRLGARRIVIHRAKFYEWLDKQAEEWVGRG